MGRHRRAAWGFFLLTLAIGILAVAPLPPAARAETTAPAARAEAAAPAARAGAISFTIESIDPAEQAGHLSSIQLAADGSPRIAYMTAAGELRYAERSGAGWTWEIVPQPGYVVDVSLALDPSGEPWIAFHNNETVGIYVYDFIKVAHRAGGTWTVDTIGNTDPSLSGAAIAFDPAGVAHLAWGNLFRGLRIYYASWSESGWSSEIVHQASYGEGFFGLAFDAQGVPHLIASTDEGNLHAVFVSPTWTKEFRPYGWFPSLALDSNGQPHIATIRVEGGTLPLKLEYEWRGTDGVWHQEELADLSLNYAPNAALRLDANDRPLIATTDGATITDGGTLKLFRKPEGSWISEDVATGGVGLYPSLALAGGTNPRISYTVEGSGLHYAAGEFTEEPPEALPARAFLAGAPKTVALAGPSRADLCVQLEPVDGAFDAEDLVPTSIVMRSEGTGTVSEIGASSGKGVVLGDRDRNGVAEMGACFARADLASLFSSLEGRTTVAVTIEGALGTGERVSAPLELTVLLPKGLIARVYPNPLNPSGRISFTARRAGPLRVMLFDVTGRMVRVIAEEGRASAGPREIAFDGTNDRGVSLATGVYFYRIESAGDVITGRIAIAK